MVQFNTDLSMRRINEMFDDNIKVNSQNSLNKSHKTSSKDSSVDEDELVEFEEDDNEVQSDSADEDDNIADSFQDEYGNLYVKYKDETEEVYAKDEDGELFLYEKTRKTDSNEERTEYYSKEGLITGDALTRRDYDERKDTLKIRNVYTSRENGDTSYSMYEYQGKSDDPEKFSRAVVQGVQDGREYQTNYEVKRDSSGNIISFEETSKYTDGTSGFHRFDGKRGEDAMKAFLDGQYYSGMTNESIKYDDKGNVTSRVVRDIDETGALKFQKEYDGNGNLKVAQGDYAMDGYVGTAYQGQTGDCYLLASINSLAQGSEGQRILRENVTEIVDENGKKAYKVNFPGAQIARDELSGKLGKDNVFIQGSYVVTQDEMDEANKDVEAFSDGDQNVLLYELAFNKYRHDVKSTVEKNNINPDDTFNIMGLEGYSNPNAPIDGGFGSEAKFILTGKRSDAWFRDMRNYNSGIELDTATHTAKTKDNVPYISYDSGDNPLKGKETTNISRFMQTANIGYSDEKLDELIKKIIEDSRDGIIDENAVTIGLYVGYADRNGFGPHEISIVSMDENEVTFVDSNDKTLGNARKYTISMEEFKKGITSLDVMSLK